MTLKIKLFTLFSFSYNISKLVYHVTHFFYPVSDSLKHEINKHWFRSDEKKVMLLSAP